MIMGTKSRRRTAVLCVACLSAAVLGISLLYPITRGDVSRLSAPVKASALPGTQLALGQTMVSTDFSTHLPIVVIDTGEQEPKSDSVWDDTKGYQVPVDYDPYASGNIYVIDSEEGNNTLSDTPDMKSAMKIRLRGNSSVNFPKKQYLVKLYSDEGEKNPQDLLGMGEDWEWILNVSWHDPSLLRNFIAYTAGKETTVLSPDVRYCELVRRKGDDYEYLGVYLLMENAERSKNRVDVPAYRPNQTLSYILRRDRYDEDGTMLNTYGEQSGLVQGFLEVKYPSANKIAERDVERIRNEISAFEQALFAEDTKTFLTYPTHINMDTFIDYFIINELFMNYDAGFNSTYLHKGHTAKLTMGPFWDFDQAMANDREFENRLDSTAFHNAPWFRQLLRDPNFTRALVNRYHELRQGSLSSASIDKLIDDTVDYLDTATQRDWSRWQYELTTPPGTDGSVPVSFYDEVKHVRDILTIHGAWLDEHIDSLYQFSDPSISVVEPEETAQEKADLYGDLLAVVYIAAFLISVVLIRREA